MNTSELSKKIKQGIKWQAIISVFSQALYFINGVILARILGPKEFGVYGMAQIVSSFVWMFWQLGLNAAIVQRKEIDRAHLDTAFTISMIMGIICAVLTWFSAPFIAAFFNEPKVIPLTRVIAFTFVIYAFDRVPSALLGRELKFKEAAIPGLLNAIIYPLVAIPLALMGFGAMSFVWGVVAGAVGMLIVRYYWLFKHFDWRPRIYFDKKSAKDLLGFGVFLTLKSLLDFVSLHLQKILIGRYIGSLALGFYNRADNLSNYPVNKVLSIFSSVLLPSFSRVQNDRLKIKNWYQKFIFFTYFVLSFPLFFLLFNSSQTINIIFGSKWSYSSRLLIWTTLAALVSLPRIYWENMLTASGLPKVLFNLRVVQLPFLFVILFWGIKIGGVLGLAIGFFSFSALILFPVYSIALWRYLHISIWDTFLSIWEPMLIFLCGSFGSSFLCAHTFNFWNPLVKFIMNLLIYNIWGISYYFIRLKLVPFISYIGFKLDELIRL